MSNEILSQILSELKGLKTQVSENTQILKSLEHSAQINKSEHDQIINNLAYLTGEVKSISDDLIHVEQMTGKNIYDIAKLKSIK